MRFSLILATLGRYSELDRCLSALSKQIFKDFEVILIDQNKEGFLNELVSKYKWLHFKTLNIFTLIA